MRIAVLSDIHDRMEHLERILVPIQSWRPEALILCGDLTRPAVLSACRLPGASLSFCLGNCDRDQADALRHEAGILGAHAWGEVGRLSLPDGGTVAFTHFPAVARRLSAEAQHRAVFFGHTHKAFEERPGGGALLANPGDVQGRHGRVSALGFDSGSGALRWFDA